jgi:hypothetical protein
VVDGPELSDHVVALRPLASRDVPAVERALADPEISRWFDNRGLTAGDVVERAVQRWERSEAAEFAIHDGSPTRGMRRRYVSRSAPDSSARVCCVPGWT